MATVRKFASSPDLDMVGKRGDLSPTCDVVFANSAGHVLIATLSPMFKSLSQWRRAVQAPVMSTPDYNQSNASEVSLFSSGDLLVMHGWVGEGVRIFLSCATTVGYDEITLSTLFEACCTMLLDTSLPMKGGKSAGAEVSESSIVSQYAMVRMKLADLVVTEGVFLGLVAEKWDGGDDKVKGKPSSPVQARKRLEIPVRARECWDAYSRAVTGSSDSVNEEVDLTHS